MSKTHDLRTLITAQLGTLSGVAGIYHRMAPRDAAYPYIVFTLEQHALRDLSRDDIDLCVDVWDRSDNPTVAEGIADAAEALFNAANLPQTTILPTVFRDNRYPVEDDDKLLQHIQLHFTVQNYAIPTT